MVTLTVLLSLQPYAFVWEEPLVGANNGGVGDLARCHCRPVCMAPSVPFAERPWNAAAAFTWHLR